MAARLDTTLRVAKNCAAARQSLPSLREEFGELDVAGTELWNLAGSLKGECPRGRSESMPFRIRNLHGMYAPAVARICCQLFVHGREF